MNSNNELYASLPRRMKASIIDSLVVLSLFVLLPVSIKTLFPTESIFSALLMYFPVFILEPILISYLGATIGQYIFGIEVVRRKTHAKCPLLFSLLRYYTKMLLGGFSFIYMLFSKKHQAIHDHFAGTIVILSKKRIKANPDFAIQGEPEQFSDTGYTYPSALRRFIFFIVWYLVASLVLGILVEVISLAILPDYTLEMESYPQVVEIAYNTVLSVTFILVALLASQGYLLGARKSKISQ